MMNQKKAIFSLLCAASLAGCQLAPMTGAGPSGQPGMRQVTSTPAIRGKVEWPRGFQSQATLADVVGAATVSLIDGVSNTTIATGLTDDKGNFSINPNASFNPSTGDTFILEAVKGLGNNQPGHSMARLRTLIQRTANGWDDVDKRTGITITLKTSTLAYLQSLYNIPAFKFINGTADDGEFKDLLTLDNYPGDEGVAGKLTAATQNKFFDNVITKALAEDRDPLGAVFGLGTIRTIIGNGVASVTGGTVAQTMPRPGLSSLVGVVTDMKVMESGGVQKVFYYDSTTRQLCEATFVSNNVDGGAMTVRSILNPLSLDSSADATASVDGKGRGPLAGLRGVGQFDVFSDGKIVFADSTAHAIRIAYPDDRSANGYAIVTVAGEPGTAGTSSGVGRLCNDSATESGGGLVPTDTDTASVARFRTPYGISIEKDKDGNPLPLKEARIFVADSNNNAVRMLVPRTRTGGPGGNKESLYDRTLSGTGTLTGSRLPVYDAHTIAGDVNTGQVQTEPEDQEFFYTNATGDARNARFNKIQRMVYRTDSNEDYGNPDQKIHQLYFTESGTNVVRRLFKQNTAPVTSGGNWGVDTFVGGRGGDASVSPNSSSATGTGNAQAGSVTASVGGSRLGAAADPNPGALLRVPASLTYHAPTKKLYVSTYYARLFEIDADSGATAADSVRVIQGQLNLTGVADGPASIGGGVGATAIVSISPDGRWLYLGDRNNFRVRRLQLK